MTLAEFLSARLDEDLASANAARASDGGLGMWLVGRDGESVEDPDHVHVVYHEDGTPDAATAAHIARWCPWRVLGEVEAKRRILDRYQGHLDRLEDPEESHYSAAESIAEYDDWVLLALALPFADHPEFDPAWRD